MSWFSSLFHGGRNPSYPAQGYLDQIPGITKPYYQPFIDKGKEAGDKLSQQYDDQTTNPGGVYSNLGKGYKESPGYQFKLKTALGAAQNSSAAGGMLGTPQDQQQQMQVGNDIASQDFNEYMQHMMDLYSGGQKGQQTFQQQGFDSSTKYGDNLGNVLGQKAQYGYAGQAGQNASQSQLLSNLISLLTSGAGGILGGLK